MTYDVIILGTGPAGLAAAVAAKGRNHSVLVIGNSWKGSPLAKAEWVENYLGMPHRTGKGMLEEMHAHAISLGVEVVTGRVVSMMAWEGYALTVGNEVYQGKTLILAPGVVRQAKFEGEDQYLGKGVSYCATCDGMLYRNKKVVVVGKSAEAPKEANYLKSIGCDVTYVAAKKPDGLEEMPFIHANRMAIQGENTVTGLTVEGETISCDGIFILREAVAPGDLLAGLSIDKAVITVDRQMRTNLEGVFAAGDCTGLPLQVAKAVGEGHIAGLSASEYLAKQK